MTLSTTVDSTYANRTAGDAQHQQDHDVIHAAVNALDAAYTTATGNGFVGTRQAWLEQLIQVIDDNASGFGFVVDEDDMTSNSATKVPTQQSVKAYVDGQLVSGGAVVTDQNVRIAGDVTLSVSAAWQDVDNNLDLTVAAAAGDVVGLSVLGRWGTGSTNGGLTFVTRVAAAEVNNVSTATFGPWAIDGEASEPIAGMVLYTVGAGDLDGGTVTFRLRGKAVNATKAIKANSDTPLYVHAVNYR